MYQYIKNLIQRWFSNVKSPVEAYIMYNEIIQESNRQYKQAINKLQKED